MRIVLPLLLCLFSLPPALAGRSDAAPQPDVGALEARAQQRWDATPYGTLLRRILPPGPKAAALPEPDSDGARLLLQYCVQCHNLPSPAMHTPQRWGRIVERMVWRMEGRGNMGELMQDLMDKVKAPTAAEKEALLAYLRRHGQSAIDPARYPALHTAEGEAFRLACDQCHALPDPKRYTAQEWPRVVERMKQHVTWAGTIEGAANARYRLREDEIVRFLQQNGRAR